MGRIGKLVKTAIDKYIVQTVEAYLGANITAETFAASGDDSPPLADDRIVLVKIDESGNFAAIGVLSESQGAKPGEKILYSRDKNGEVQAALKLLNDGKIEMISPDDFSLEGKKLALKADEIKIEGKETELTGGKVKCKGTATPDGTGCFCGIAYCPYTGAPQTGTNVNGA